MGYISSNANGYFNLAQLDITTEKLVWLTQGDTTDTFPALTVDGNLYFLRRDTSGQHLAVIRQAELAHYLSAENDYPEVTLVKLPKYIQKLRYLEGI